MEYESESGASSREIAPYATRMPGTDVSSMLQVGIQYAGPDIDTLERFVGWMRDLDFRYQCHS